MAIAALHGVYHGLLHDIVVVDQFSQKFSEILRFLFPFQIGMIGMVNESRMEHLLQRFFGWIFTMKTLFFAHNFQLRAIWDSSAGGHFTDAAPDTRSQAYPNGEGVE